MAFRPENTGCWGRGAAWEAAKLRLVYWGLEGGAKRSCKGGIVAVATLSFSPSKCISIAELLGGQQQQKEEAKRICNNSQYLKSRKVRSVFKGGMQEKEGRGRRCKKLPLQMSFSKITSLFRSFSSSFLLLPPSLFFSLSAFSNIRNPGQTETKKSLKTIIIETPTL